MRVLGYLSVLSVAVGMASAQDIDYASAVRPILSKNCFACHGNDAEHREADLRLDVRGSALALREGVAAIVPGSSQDSALYQRITASDPVDRMPPASSGHQLKPAEIAALKSWIEQGARYTEHWAFVPPVRPAIPDNDGDLWARNPIDNFVLRRLREKGLSPADEADRHALIRRLSLDLTGLPPDPEEVREFVESESLDAYETLVDRVLASPRYGERWARVWMDLARYSDTQGYEQDGPRTIWPWRDWVIQALNKDMPYDQFTIEQLAGDMLEGATNEQVLATAFHRNTMTNNEGGTDNEEFRIAAVKDRVDTTGVVWLGLSVGCAKCHSHKYDPLSQTEYYQLFAFFNQSADADRGDDAPRRQVLSPYHYDRHQELVSQLAQARRALASGGAEHAEVKKQIAGIQARLDAESVSVKKGPSVPVMQDLSGDKRRTTRLLVKGDFLNPGAVVRSSVPGALHPMSEGAPRNRLGLARWLMAPDNPLTARVTVNRIWSRIFGLGLVETEEDFGTQGALPSHPQLLDWLAIEFRDEHQWSLKKLCKTIVMSATYRQDSTVREELASSDPRNETLARGPRFRLEAEMVRDQALAVSGLLSHRLYGPPVMPPQPKGLWKTVYNSKRWVTSAGEDRYRRGLYTFAKRTTAYPSFMIFDAGSGEVCLPRRIRTNTVTAALVTLNDPVYTEAAQALARMIVTEQPGTSARRVAFAWQRVTGRPGTQAELDKIFRLLAEQSSYYKKDREAAKEMATVPLGPVPEGADVVELAAWTVVASVLLNLDETLSKG